MKDNITLLAALLTTGLRPSPQITDGNRVHRNRAPDGSPAARDAIARAAAKRARKAARSVAPKKGPSDCAYCGKPFAEHNLGCDNTDSGDEKHD